MIDTQTEILTTNGTRPSENALRAFAHCFGLLDRIMQPYFTRFGISSSHWGVLRHLYRAEQEGLRGLRLTDLSERLLIRPPSVTGVVDRLERAGFVVRGGSAIDLRTKQVVLTPAGRQLIERILKSHGEQLDLVMSGLTPDEQLELHRLLEKWGTHLNDLLARTG
jgi:DNA-binding MarR family transcriptional regulator